MKITISNIGFLMVFFFSMSCFSQHIKKEKDTINGAEFNVVPYLNYNNNLEFMFGAIPMIMYKVDKEDTVSPKSLSGMAAVYTTNSSFFLTGFTRLYFAEDTWRLHAFAFYGNLNSQLYIDDLEAPGFYDYLTNSTILSIGVDRKIIDNLYGGIAYTFSDAQSVVEQDMGSSDNTTNGIQFKLASDTRDNVYYPRSGYQANLKWKTFQEWLGNDISANKISLAYNQYVSVRDGKDVIAGRVFGVFGLGEITFEQQVVIGRQDIRGYSEAKYRGDGKVAIQGEYRWNFKNKMGVVGFAGLATIYGSDTSSFNGKLYPGIGAGYRYKAFKRSDFNIGLDGAIGKDDWGVYFRIGEAF
ncbi:BamA/TamA family outer membrane protein [Bizionia sp. KMM 8389]